MKLVSDHGKLLKLFTQNIDTLELAAGVPTEKIVFAHGSFGSQSCIDCKSPYPHDEMGKHIEEGEVARCKECNGLVKPDITFFGEALPDAFFTSQDIVHNADLVFVMGSSLSVYPFAGLPIKANEDAPRVLMNMDKVGEIGSRLEDVVWLGECDDGVRELAEHLGWWEELETKWKELKGLEKAEPERQPGEKLDDEALEKEVEKLTGEVERTLQLTGDYKQWVEGNIKQEGEKQETVEGSAKSAEEKLGESTIQQSQTEAAKEKEEDGKGKMDAGDPANKPAL